MSFSRDPTEFRRARPAENAPFAAFSAQAGAPLIEIGPAQPGDEAAALGFALAWAQKAAPEGAIFWAMPGASLAEEGAPHAEGMAQFGLPLDRLMLARTRTQADALWAAEQALTLPHALVLCTIAPSRKPLSLTATRRLLLAAEKHNSHCVLLRLDGAGASAAWMRWRISAAPSRGEAHELGAPAFTARLTRHRGGQTGRAWRLEWNAHAHVFHAAEAALDGGVAGAPADRPADARQSRAA